MELNINERMVIIQVCPEKGNFKTMTTVDNLRRILHLSEEEVVEYGFTQGPEGLAWNKKGIVRKELKISELQTELIMESFEKLNSSSELTLQQFQVYKHLKEELEKPEDKK